jgi:hypothetical protein
MSVQTQKWAPESDDHTILWLTVVGTAALAILAVLL